ncbi:MAG TPA: hypothetical protein VGR57_13100 [Ktedonobacterales bacterium]|nr:hypothetical protein [Ktedonobacterales bacterium]
MIEFPREPDAQSAAPELREQVSAVRDRIAELVLVVVGISGALGLATNLLASYLHDGRLAPVEWLALLAALALAAIIALVAVARLRLTTRELDEEVELALPLLIPASGAPGSPIEVIEVFGYQGITEMGHAAVARLTTEQNTALAQAARRIDRGVAATAPALTIVPAAEGEDDAEDEEAPAVAPSNDPVLWFLQLAQLLVAAQCLDESERLLGNQALYHRGRWLRRRTRHVRDVAWADLAATAGGANPFISAREAPGVRQRTTIPASARLTLTNVADELAHAKQEEGRRRPASAGERGDGGVVVPLLRIEAGRAGGLVIAALKRVSAHGQPRLSQPQAGLTTRVLLRNARSTDLRRRALEEESAATLRADGGVPRPGARPLILESTIAMGTSTEALAAEHNRAWRALYRAGRRPRVARVYLTVEGRFRVRLASRGSQSDNTLYAWATALARRVGTLDVDVYMAALAARQQVVPLRRF